MPKHKIPQIVPFLMGVIIKAPIVLLILLGTAHTPDYTELKATLLIVVIDIIVTVSVYYKTIRHSRE